VKKYIVAGTYSEQQNCSTKGQISLVSQIVAQRTKGKSWENHETKEYMYFVIVPNYRHLAPFIDFILTLDWGQFGGTVLLHTSKGTLYTCII
jgi:hypothetical protein